MFSIKIIPLGGVRENGKNLYVIDVEDNIFILDCGLRYPETELLGIDVIIPDLTYLEKNYQRIKGVFLTHGHADSIGSLPYLLEKLSVPVFGTELTIELAKLSVQQHNQNKTFKNFHIVDEKMKINFGKIKVSFFPTTHTFPDSIGIVLETTEGNIVYTGDFKFDQTATKMYQTDFYRLAEIGKQGVIALLSNSKNAENSMPISSETQIFDEICDTIQYCKSRIIIACVASNLQRVQQVLDAAYFNKRKVLLIGQDFDKIIRIAINLEKIHLPLNNILIKKEEIKKYNPEEVIILETGHMGEPIKSLQKMANGTHPIICIQDDDLVYITTNPNISMETVVGKTEDMIYRSGGIVKSISDTLCISGHANSENLQLMLNLIKPKYFIPVQGEYRQLIAHSKLAQSVGIPKNNIFILKKGDILEYTNKSISLAGSIPSHNIMIDGMNIGDIGYTVLKDRKILSQEGIILVASTINRREKRIISSPKIISRGFIYIKNNYHLIKESEKIVSNVIDKHLHCQNFEWSKMKQNIREKLNRYLFEKTKLRPIVLPVIVESSNRYKNRLKSFQ